MKKNYNATKISATLLAGAVLLGGEAPAQTVQAFPYTGSVQQFIVPPCVNQFTFEVWGAEGGGSALSSNSSSGLGGKGGYAKGSMTVVPGSTLYIYVGGYGQSATNGLAAGGFNGGGSGYASSSGEPGNGGGGATDIRLNGQAFSDRVIVAGGGGGGGEDSGDSYGDGGGLTGVGYSGFDATQTAAGPGGGIGFGGTTGMGDGGGGGGGYYGGGTYSSTSIGVDTQGGGGGSGYVGTLTQTVLIAGNMSMPNASGGGSVTGRSGDGYARITYALNGTAVSVINSTAGVCTGSSTSLYGTGVVSYTWLPTGNFAGSNSGTVLVSPTSNTTYTLQGTNSQGCVTTTTAYVVINTSTPVLSVSNPSNSICLGQTATLTASGAITYTWANPGVVNGQTFMPGATAVYTVYGQNGCGISSAVTNITVTPLTIPASANPATLCAGQSAFLNASGASTYSWMPGTMTGSTPIVTPTISTVYTVTASDGTCSGASQVTVTVKQNPTLTVVGTATTICDGESVTITVSGADTYTWNPAAITGTSGIVTPTASVSYQVLGTNSLGCTAAAFHIVIVKPKPVITGNLTSTLICSGNTVALNAGGASTYTWSHGPTNPSITVTPAASTVYVVTGAGTNSCIATRAYSVDVAQAVLNVSGSASVCEGSAVTFTALNGTSHAWSNNGGNFPTATYTPSATTVYSVTASVNVGGNLLCPASATVQAIVNPNPTVTVTAPSTVICRKDPLVITAGGASSYSWNVAGSGASITFTSLTITTHSIIVTGTADNGCKSTSAIQVKVNSCNGVEELPSVVSVKVYPNPNNGTFRVEAREDIVLTLFNSLGQQVRTISLNDANHHTAELHDVAAGVYFLLAGERATGRIVVTR